ncbi:hypothetical protein CXB51_034280 [Gossypium anomalum]|uniref:Uncharacterized protein n=1 Tax=Gossypium anomalum TaxID=47600 RepID=A0A8J5XW83_9ROSI|nr:hypothetical protein CXB51_034280 [Gossypium anomalum]
MYIREEFETVLHHKEILWRQKVHCDWLVLGDHNTKFFHTCTLRRRRHNRISALKNCLGDCVMDDEQLKIEAINFYSNLYGEHPRPRKDFPSSAFLRLNDGDLNFLSRPVIDEEIKNSFFAMAPLKAPGSDGYHDLFY